MPPRRLRPLILACSLLLAVPAAASAASVADVPGEGLDAPAAAGVVADAAAEGGRALALWSDTTATGSVDLPGDARAVTVRVRGTTCRGAPTLQVTVDGKPLFSADVTGTGYAEVGVPAAVATGRHAVGVALVNDFRASATCDRGLAVDRVSFLPAAELPAGATIGDTAGVPAVPVPRTLAWAPPVLTAPRTIQVAQGDQWLTLDPAKDYVLALPASGPHYGSLIVVGGRNVVIRGGSIVLPAGATRKVGIGIRNNTGTVHIEGVLIDGSSGAEMDAINISSPRSTVQVENVRATGLFGSVTTNHSDVIQPYGGVAALRVDRLSGDSNYQGLFTRPDGGPIGAVDVRNTDLSFDDAAAGPSGGYLLWMTTGCDMAPTRLSNVYVRARATAMLGAAVWPSSHDAQCPAKITNGTASWPSLPVDGGVIGGTPPGGPFVAADLAGPGYETPGYGTPGNARKASLPAARRKPRAPHRRHERRHRRL